MENVSDDLCGKIVPLNIVWILSTLVTHLIRISFILYKSFYILNFNLLVRQVQIIRTLSTCF